MKESVYVPILKGKEGEYGALRELAPEAKSRLTPVIEIPDIPWDFEDDQPAKTIGEHLRNVARKLEAAWGDERPFFIDLLWIPDDARMADGQHPLAYVFDAVRGKGLQAIPVTGLRRDAGYQAAVRAAARADHRGVCLRLEADDFEDLDTLALELDQMLGNLGVEAGSCDVIIDLNEMPPSTTAAMALTARTFVNALPRVQEWRTLTIAGSSFPVNLADVDAASETTIRRVEWQVWRSLLARRDRLARLPLFGDYAIAHPELAEVDPRLVRMSANLRYTTETDWLVLKGRNVRRYGYGQFNDLCRRLVTRPDYSGRRFSWGDSYISDCARGVDGPGSATTWRKAGTSHHLTLVVSQLSTILGL